MRVALFGASGFIGTSVLEELLTAGHQVNALIRNPARVAGRAGLIVVQGDVGDADAVARTIDGTEAVISCLGTPPSEQQSIDFLADALRRIMDAMERFGVERLVAISGAAITVTGERKAFPHNVISAVVRALARDMVAAKQTEFAVLQASSTIAWTAVRPTRVVSGSATDRPRVTVDAGQLGMRVTRGDLARFMVGQLTDRSYIRQAPFISS
ncbi:MAG: NAD(P)H-binding protein [Candidatus Dormiibacterota bacterium]